MLISPIEIVCYKYYNFDGQYNREKKGGKNRNLQHIDKIFFLEQQ